MLFLAPTTDITFKKVFADKTKHEVLIAFLKAVTGKSDITDITHSEAAAQPKIVWMKSPIESIRCVDAHGATYIIDMHITDQADYIERCQYYVSLEIARQWTKTESYKKLSPVRFIGISQFSVFSDDAFMRACAALNTATHAQELPLQEFYFIELSKFTKSVDKLKKEVDQWAYFLKNSGTLEEIPAQLQENSALVAAFDALRQTNFTKKELESYTELVEAHKLETSRIQGARLEGEHEAALRIARKMAQQGMDAETISMITGLATVDCARFQAQQ
jgi:predicted transposase/invertase (TIGR01784 family)